MSYISLFVSFHLVDEGNPINQNFRINFLKHDIIRQALLLNDSGDDRFRYLKPLPLNVVVEIDYQTGVSPDIEAEYWVREMISETLGKDVEVIVNEDKNIPDLPIFTDNQIAKLLKSTKNEYRPDSNYLHIIYISSSSVLPNNSGSVVGPNEIIIFKDTINSLTKDTLDLKKIEHSTIQHEFGHILGLKHTERENCVMSETVEVFEDDNKKVKNNIPLTHCADSLVELDKIKSYI